MIEDQQIMYHMTLQVLSLQFIFNSDNIMYHTINCIFRPRKDKMRPARIEKHWYYNYFQHISKAKGLV